MQDLESELSNNNNFNIQITDSLTINNACFESGKCVIIEGKSTISTDIYQDRELDYGNNLCDCKVNIEINNEPYLIVID